MPNETKRSMQKKEKTCSKSNPSSTTSMALPIGNRSQRPLRLLNILNQILNRANLDPPFPSKPQTPIPSHHPITPPNLRDPIHQLPILDQLCDHTRRRLPSQPAQLHRRLGVACSLAHAAGAGAQGDDVAWAAEVLEARGGRGQGAAG